MSPQDFKKYEELLLKRKVELEKELGYTPLTVDMGDESEGVIAETEADEAEEMTTNYAIRKSLKEELNDVKDALKKIQGGVYGKCEKCGMEIEKEVLEADVESRFCKSCKSVGLEPKAT